MFIRDVRRCERLAAPDGTDLCELVHPYREYEDLKMAYSLAHAVLRPGERSRPHRLERSSEVYYILEGEGTIHVGSESAGVYPGHAVYIPPGSVQYIENGGDENLSFLCIVSPPWRPEEEEEEEDTL